MSLTIYICVFCISKLKRLINVYKHLMLLGKKRKAIVKGRSVAEFDKDVTFLDVRLMSEFF